MQLEQTKEKSKNKFIIVVGLSLVAVAILGFATVLILRRSSPAPSIPIESKASIQNRAKTAFSAAQTALAKGDFAVAKSDFLLANTLYIKSGDLTHRSQIDSLLSGIANQENVFQKPVQPSPTQAPAH